MERRRDAGTARRWRMGCLRFSLEPDRRPNTRRSAVEANRGNDDADPRPAVAAMPGGARGRWWLLVARVIGSHRFLVAAAGANEVAIDMPSRAAMRKTSRRAVRLVGAVAELAGLARFPASEPTADGVGFAQNRCVQLCNAQFRCYSSQGSRAPIDIVTMGRGRGRVASRSGRRSGSDAPPQDACRKRLASDTATWSSRRHESAPLLESTPRNRRFGESAQRFRT